MGDSIVHKSYTLGGNYVENASTKYFNKLSGVSANDVRRILAEAASKSEFFLVLTRADAGQNNPDQLRVYYDSGFYRIEVMDPRSEWGCRTLSNMDLINSVRYVEIQGELYLESATTADAGLVLNIMLAFLTTGDVPETLFPY
jgi:hypothetical protein